MTLKRSSNKFIRAFHFDKLNDNVSGRTRKIDEEFKIHIYNFCFMIDGQTSLKYKNGVWKGMQEFFVCLWLLTIDKDVWCIAMCTYSFWKGFRSLFFRESIVLLAYELDFNLMTVFVFHFCGSLNVFTDCSQPHNTWISNQTNKTKIFLSTKFHNKLGNHI